MVPVQSRCPGLATLLLLALLAPGALLTARAETPPAPAGDPAAAKAEPCVRLFEALAEFKTSAFQLPERVESASLEQMRERWAAMESGFHWQRGIDNELDFLRLVRREHYIKNQSTTHGTEMYGIDVYRAWKKADERLNNIPVGSLKLDKKLFAEVHDITSKPLFSFLKKIERVIPDGYVPDKGGIYKKRDSWGRDPLFHPLTEEQYKAIKENPWIEGFAELPSPLSKPGARRGRILYSSAETTQAKLDKLIKWYEDNKATKDPVELAAEFQHAFVSIHPFVDGNGRTSRLLMDRILREHGLPPPLLKDSSSDIYLSVKDYTQEVRRGIDDYLTLAEDGKVVTSWGDAAQGFLPARLSIAKLNRSRPAFSQSVDRRGQEFSFGGRPHIFMTDGFFYNNHGVPHAFHDGKLYPISDRSHFLYDVNARDLHYGKVKPSEAHRDVFREHFALIKSIDQGKIDPKQIPVEPYAVIEEANLKGQIHLYDWQKPMFEKAVISKSDDPTEILSRTRTTWTSLDTAARRGIPLTSSPSDILAHYVRADQQQWEYLQAAKKYDPAFVPKIEEERRKLHKAARELLKPFYEARNALPSESQQFLYQYHPLKVFDEYLMKTKLGYADYDDAVRKLGDDSMVVLRNDSSVASYTGFLSQRDWVALTSKAPGFEKFKGFVKALDKYQKTPEGNKFIRDKLVEIAKKGENPEGIYAFLPANLREQAKKLDKTYEETGRSFLDTLANKILISEYEIRGAATDQNRLAPQLKMHGANQGSKIGKSFTTNPNLLSTGMFLNQNVSGGTFMVKVPREKAVWQFGTPNFPKEYEILTTDPLGPGSILKYFDKEKSFFPVTGMPSKEVEGFLSKFHFGN